MRIHDAMLGRGLPGVLLIAIASLMTAPAGAETLTVDLPATPFQIISTESGQRIEMDGFGHLAEPGKPLLPVKKFLLALPPGATVQAVEVSGWASTELAGSYAIVPAPPIRPLSWCEPGTRPFETSQREWRENKAAAYGSDRHYPREVGGLAGAGTLRKYAYVAVSFCPFSYYPRSGRLVHHAAARVTVDYSLPAPGSPEEKARATTMRDKVADDRARQLFVNFQEMAQHYQLQDAAKQPKAETCDYVIIVPESLYPTVTASEFIAWKEAIGHEVIVVLIAGGKIENQRGRDLAESMRNFLRDNYLDWGVEFVLLVGDYIDTPMRYCYPDPTNHSGNPGTPNAYSGEVPTDFYFADLSYPDSLSWDSDRDGFYGEFGEDSPDLLADVYVGRIPTSDPGRITYTLDKLVAFEQDTGRWKSQALHGASIAFFENEDYLGYPFKDLATFISYVENDFMGDWLISHYSELAGLSPSPFPWDALDPTIFVDDWRTGQYGIVNWGGHGWPHGAHGKVWDWDDGDGVPESESPVEISHYQFVGLASDLDDDYPSLVFALSCLIGYPEPNAWGNMGIDILTAPDWGAAAGILCGSRVVWVSAGGGESMCYEFNHYLIDGPTGPCKLGEAVYDSKYAVYQGYSMNHYAEYWNQFTYNLYGEPALHREGATPVVAVDESGPPPAAAVLLQNVPNPFNPSTEIRYFVPSSGERVTLRVYDLAGRHVRTLVDGPALPGENRVVWGGLDDWDRPCSSGVYIYRLVAGKHIETKRMVLVR